jgi:hypothetical protein
MGRGSNERHFHLVIITLDQSKAQVSDRLWNAVQGFAVTLHNRLPNVVPQRYAAVLRAQVQWARALWEKMGWPVAALGAAGAVMGALLVFMVARNRQLARALHSKETEMTRLLIKVRP